MWALEQVQRGDIWEANLGISTGSEQGGKRPVIIVSNNIGNRYSPTYIAVPLTSRCKTHLPTHGTLNDPMNGLDSASTFLCEQIKTIDKSRMIQRRGRLTSNQMAEVDVALRIAIDLTGLWKI